MADVVRASGVVTIGPAQFVVEELSVQGEFALLAAMRRGAKDAMGATSFYANALPVADALRKIDKAGEAAALLNTTAHLVATGGGVSDDAAWAFRETPDGVATELFRRTRRTQPDTTLAEIRAVVNDANAPDVRGQLDEALAPKKA